MTGRLMLADPVGAHDQLRDLALAAILGLPAARVEAAAGRGIRR